MARDLDHSATGIPLIELSTQLLRQLSVHSQPISTTGSKDPEGRESPTKENDSFPPGDDKRVNLRKYGLPEALTKFNQVPPDTIDYLINSSVENILTQITAENEIQWCLQEAERRRSEHNSDQAKEGGGRLVKGKEVDRIPLISTSTGGSNSPSGLFDRRLVPTPPPSEETISFPTTDKASPSTESEISFPPETAATATATGSSSPTVNTSPSTPSNIKKRQFVKAVFGRLSDTDPYFGLLRHHSTGDLHQIDLGARLKKTKLALRFSQETGECISCFDEFYLRNLVMLRCHNYCKPCFRRLIENALETEAQWPPKCCLDPIDHKTCLRNISGALSVKYMQKRQEYSTPINTRYYCPTPDCGLFVPADKPNTPFRRAKCKSGHLTCMDCRQAAHEDAVQCVKNRDMDLVQKLAAEEGWMRCHRCHTMIEHKTACRHMVCRCGAQFCMVCGAVWWTCGCTEKQLEEMKLRAKRNSERRKEQEERERREMQELHEALEAIAKMEAEESEKMEKIRVAKEARRKVQVTSTYAELRALLGEVNGFQKDILQGQHERGRRELLTQIQTAEEGLNFKHVAKMDELRKSSKKKMDEKEKELCEGYKAGASRETSDNISDEQITRIHPEGGTSNDEDDCEADEKWSQYRDEQLKQFRWAVADEQAIEEELMQAKTARILESFKVQQRELEVKTRSEIRWYDLVVAERLRLLEELLVIDLEDKLLGVDDSRWESIVV
ncbi:E3 ubiquitin-protein ligase arih1l [Cytospora mali]|uniref:RBR-type E3 ubiquitin transferase n=1 Tax=Cytospora mali TaxID=578113 RepID=A0A194VRF3_CYTMA|nr:E3 ubiquitin-protein ligase arih1l [Valsa mali]